MKDIKESSKPERKSIHDRDKERRNRSSKDSAGQNQAINSLTPAGGPQPLMSQGKKILPFAFFYFLTVYQPLV